MRASRTLRADPRLLRKTRYREALWREHGRNPQPARGNPVDQQRLSATQFGARAGNYLSSTVHAKGADLGRLEALAREAKPARALDVGCGAGHARLRAGTRGARQVVAYDPSPDMLSVVAQEAALRGLAALETRAGAAEVLPFESELFDVVVTRFSAHHWADVPKAMAQCARGFGQVASSSSSTWLHRSRRCSTRHCRSSSSCAMARMCATTGFRMGSDAEGRGIR